MNQVLNLHTVSALKEIHVSDEVKLRPLKHFDAHRLLDILAADISIRDKVTVASRFVTVNDIDEEIKRYSTDPGLIRYTLLQSDNPIGLVSLWRYDGYFGTIPQPNSYGFGYFLDPVERGKGLVTNSIKALMDTTQKYLTVDQFLAFCEDKNRESIAVLKRLGFNSTNQTFKEPLHGWIERKYVRPINKFETAKN